VRPIIAPEVMVEHGQKCDACAFIRGRRALQEEPVHANESVAVAEHEGEAPRIKQQTAQTGVYHALHKYVDGFARPAESSFQHGEAETLGRIARDDLDMPLIRRNGPV
jgi:hypothetical protein